MAKKTTNSTAAPKRRKKGPAPAKPEKAAIAKVVKATPVTEYLSYRDFLFAIYKGVKDQAKTYSYNQFAADLGFSKSNVLWLVITGRRALSPQAKLKIIEALKLTGNDRRFFEILYQYNNSRRPDHREQHFQDLLKLRNRDLEEGTQDQLEYFAEWYHPIIREMVGMKGFQSDPEWIAAQLAFGVTPRQAQKSLDLLVNLGLIEKKKDKYVTTQTHVRPDRSVNLMAGVRYHQKMCDMAKESVTIIEPQRRDLNAITFCASEETAMKVTQLFYEMADKVIALEEKDKKADKAEQVFQLNWQVFPFTKSS